MVTVLSIYNSRSVQPDNGGLVLERDSHIAEASTDGRHGGRRQNNKDDCLNDRTNRLEGVISINFDLHVLIPSIEEVVLKQVSCYEVYRASYYPFLYVQASVISHVVLALPSFHLAQLSHHKEQPSQGNKKAALVMVRR